MNLEQAHIAFLEQNLHSPVLVDLKQYFNSVRPTNDIDIHNVPGFLKGINKNTSQQFDIDFDLGNDGFEFLNCFNNLCRSWSHTAHAANIRVTKRKFKHLTNLEFKTLAFLGGDTEDDYNSDQLICIGKNYAKEISVGDESYGLRFYQYLFSIGILLPFTYVDDSDKPITSTSAKIISLKWAQYKAS